MTEPNQNVPVTAQPGSTDGYGRRNRGVRRYGCATMGTVFVAFVVCSGLVLADCATPRVAPGIARVAVPITGSVAIGTDGRTIVYSVDGTCDAPELATAETATTVTLTLTVTNAAFVDCVPLAWMVLHTVSGVLLAALNGRQLIDSVSGRHVPFGAANDALRPRAMLPGWTSSTRTPTGDLSTRMDYFGGPGAAVLVENFQALTETGWLAIVQVIGGGWQPPTTSAVVPITVNGHPGRSAPGIIVWTEAGRTVAVLAARAPRSAQPTPPAIRGVPYFVDGEPLPTRDLLAIAATLVPGGR